MWCEGMQVQLAIRLCACIVSCHELKLPHLDISIDSVVLNLHNAIVLSKLRTAPRLASLAPEQLLEGQRFSAGYAADVWAFAAVMLHLWTGTEPCAGASKEQLMQSHTVVCVFEV